MPSQYFTAAVIVLPGVISHIRTVSIFALETAGAIKSVGITARKSFHRMHALLGQRVNKVICGSKMIAQKRTQDTFKEI